MSLCSICPRKCSIDRAESAGYCGAREKAHIARAALHRWEEPIISGERGSGTVFFCGCNLNCIFCQNYKINHSVMGIEADEETLCRIMLDLQHQGAHNINLVTPAPHVPLIARTLPLARQAGLYIDNEPVCPAEGRFAQAYQSPHNKRRVRQGFGLRHKQRL